MSRDDIVILVLSIQLAMLSGLLVKAYHRIGYLEGQQDFYQAYLKATGPDGTCYVASGCETITDDGQVIKPKKRGK